RNERVAQAMSKDDEPLAKTLRPRGADVVLTEDLEHARARHARDDRSREVAKRERRQDQMQQAASQRREVAGEQAVNDIEPGACRWRGHEEVDAAATGEPAELVVAETDHDQPKPEDRDRASDQREHADDVVGKAPAKDRRPHAGWDADDDR